MRKGCVLRDYQRAGSRQYEEAIRGSGWECGTACELCYCDAKSRSQDQARQVCSTVEIRRRTGSVCLDEIPVAREVWVYRLQL